ncbi:MAG: PQQ-binding-like beta-propeller repeat protein [Vicinamibacterales bacterium]|jgi:outer membrane protein assembly factor BamB
MNPNRLSVTTLAVGLSLVVSVIALAQGDNQSVSMIELTGESAQYWPRWRGPSGQGVVTSSNYPDRWNATENVLWRTGLSGRGNSSPIVWGDYIILTTGRDAGRQLFVQAYRRSNGSLRWETEVAPGRPERVHSKNGPASATPTTDGKQIFASLGGRGIVSLDFDGNILWHSEVGSINNYHGPAGSPLLYEDLLIVYQDQRGGGFVAAYDTATGNQVWRTARNASVGWGSPIAIRVGDHDELIISSQNTVNAYNPKTGDELWHCGGNLFEVIPTPVVAAGLIFCASGRAGPTLAIRPGGQGDITDTHIAWSTSRGSPFIPSPVAYDGYLYTINDMSSIITCFDAATGTVMWQQRLGRAIREGISASPVVVDNKVFVTSDDGVTFVLKTGPEFELLHTNDIGAQTLASPALVDGIWYIRTVDELIAIGY